jgi:hypothetical protein
MSNSVYNFTTLDKVKSFLKSKCGYAEYNSNKSELVTFCPKCERERFNKKYKKGHLYISTQIPVFNCFKCSNSGSLIKLFKQHDSDIKILLPDLEINLEVKNNTYKLDRELNSLELQYTPSNDIIDLSQYERFSEKIKYLENRMGTNDINNIIMPNLVLDIKDFLNKNNIQIDKEKLKMIDYLQDKFVGFLSMKKSLVICRNIEENSNFRYYTLHLGKHTYFKDFYGIRNSEIMDTSINTIVLAEGIFDILKTINNDKFDYLKNNSCLWASCLTNRFEITLKSCLDYCKITKCNLIVLSDNDVKSYIYKKLSKHPMINNISVMWNTEGKDFGELIVKPYKKVFTRKVI